MSTEQDSYAPSASSTSTMADLKISGDTDADDSLVSSEVDGSLQQQEDVEPTPAPLHNVQAQVPALINTTGTAAPTSAQQPTSANEAARSAISADTDGLVLYDLTTNRQSGSACSGKALLFSPHTLKSIIDLKLLGIGYERQRLSFAQVRGELAERVGENVTVPTLELSDGTHLTDSWTIAEYLSSKHPNGSVLFPTPSSKSYAAFLNTYAKTHIAPHLGPIAMPGVHKILDSESAEYFEHSKVGTARLSAFKALSADERAAKAAQVAKALEPIDAALAVSASPFLEGGKVPSHADAVIFGWFVYSRAAGKTLHRDIWTAHSRVNKWTKAMLEWTGEDITKDFIQC